MYADALVRVVHVEAVGHYPQVSSSGALSTFFETGSLVPQLTDLTRLAG